MRLYAIDTVQPPAVVLYASAASETHIVHDFVKSNAAALSHPLLLCLKLRFADDRFQQRLYVKVEQLEAASSNAIPATQASQLDEFRQRNRWKSSTMPIGPYQLDLPAELLWDMCYIYRRHINPAFMRLPWLQFELGYIDPATGEEQYGGRQPCAIHFSRLHADSLSAQLSDRLLPESKVERFLTRLLPKRRAAVVPVHMHALVPMIPTGAGGDALMPAGAAGAAPMHAAGDRPTRTMQAMQEIIATYFRVKHAVRESALTIDDDAQGELVMRLSDAVVPPILRTYGLESAPAAVPPAPTETEARVKLEGASE
ncbi:hypothetical protein RI367_002323 [Sorochytrium milnesiophthora]